MKNRSINELLRLFEVNLDCVFDMGLCFSVNRLYRKDIINIEEKNHLHCYIEEHAPLSYKIYKRFLKIFKKRYSFYYWKMDKIEPRRRWLRKHINKTDIG